MRARSSLPVLVAALALAAACRSGDPVRENRERLETAQAELAAGSSEQAARIAERVLRATSRRPSHFTRQRFFAAGLLAEAHVAAALGAPFLGEPSPSTRAIGVGSDVAAGASVPSDTAHLVAGLGWVGTALALAPAAEADHAACPEEAELPPALATLGVNGLADRLRAEALACYARLGFADRAGLLAAASPALYELADARAHLSGLGIDPRLVPWIEYAAHLAARSDASPGGAERAYRFGVAAVQDAELLPERARPPADDVARWIESGTMYAFRCPTCRSTAIPGEASCLDDSTPTLEFRAEPR